MAVVVVLLSGVVEGWVDNRAQRGHAPWAQGAERVVLPACWFFVISPPARAAAATPLYGKLSDIHGRRTMMLIAIGIYATGSLACALAPTMLALILARALQGLGGGGLMPLVQTIIGDVASPRDRPRYQAYTSSIFIVSTVGGPILGGFIAEHLHWSWIFWFNLPLCGLAFLLTH